MNLLKCFALMLFMLTLRNLSYAQQPEFELKITDIKYSDTLDGKNNVLEFDIIMVHTNSLVSGPFNYFSGQYFLDFNPDIANGGNLSYSRIATDLPSGLQQGSASVSGNQLRLTASIPYSPNPVISTSSGGTLIARMRLATTANSFADVPLNLKWRISGDRNPYTKISALVDGFATEVSKFGSYNVESEVTGNVQDN